MTKDELVCEILTYDTPLQERTLKSYSRQRLEDYLSHLTVMGRKRAVSELAQAGTNVTDK